MYTDADLGAGLESTEVEESFAAQDSSAGAAVSIGIYVRGVCTHMCVCGGGGGGGVRCMSLADTHSLTVFLLVETFQTILCTD